MKRTSRGSQPIRQNRPNWRKKVIGHKKGKRYFMVNKKKIKGKNYEKVKSKK